MPSQEGTEAPAANVDLWLRAAQVGSSEALGRLLDSCRQYLLLVANRECDSDLQAKFGPSDLVQESLLEAQRDFGQFHGRTEADVLAWLRRILLNNVANVREHYRSAQKRDVGREVRLDAVLEGPGAEQLIAAEPSPSQRAVAQERGEELERALTQLPEHYREALRLRHQEDCSFEEIGAQTGRSADAARKVWARAVEQLKQALERPHESA
ncbi:MAG TPA: sigma-70 family RNA polymerase sigma factor [Gemmataceae bacterium]|jgi:RNA polymerase sigma-70 factor (ECF subfamily)|nr:sigma-70 family RNA polymerase sigma factor [Gemmataceae bacterium]